MTAARVLLCLRVEVKKAHTQFSVLGLYRDYLLVPSTGTLTLGLSARGIAQDAFNQS